MKISEQNKSWFVGNGLFGNREMTITDRIAQRKQIYEKQAMHLVTTADAGERRIDENIEKSRERIRTLIEETGEANHALKNIEQKMAEAKEAYQVEDDSQEQKDLELMQKCYDIQKHGSSAGKLTEEEKQRLADMGEPTEYQKYAMELYEQADVWKTKRESNQNKVAGEKSALRSIEISRLESQAMPDAQNVKEELMKTASKEAVGMLLQDTKEQIDEKAEKVKEEAEEKREEQEKQEERVEAVKENRTKTEVVVENNRENIEKITEQVLDSDDISQEINTEVKKILEEQKLLEEDLKGLTLDTEV